jgi:hypothetical protein
MSLRESASVRNRRFHGAQDRAPLSWTNERSDMLFRLRVREEGSGFPARSSRAERAIKHRASRQAQITTHDR